MEGGHPLALEGMQMGGGDAFGATAFAPPGGAPLPPTGAMSGFGGEPQNQGFPKPPPAAGAPPPPPPAPPSPPRASTQMPGQQPQGQPAPSADGRRALAGFLVSYQDDANGRFWPLWQGRNVIGRAETGQEVDIPIGHGTTSTHHAAIECDGPRFTLNDLGSTNGTFHNEEAIGFQGRRDLRDGDKVRFGGYTVIILNAAARV